MLLSCELPTSVPSKLRLLTSFRGISVTDRRSTVVVLHSAGAYVMEPWIMHENVTAVVFAGLPGQESGNAITDILYGVVNPSGRLPLTIAKSEADYGTNISTAHNRGTPGSYFEEGIFVDYRHFDAANIEPRYEFGFGLSYTSFTYHNLKISCPGSPFPEFPRFQKMRSGGNPQLFLKLCTATVYIKNIGARDGHEVPQLYVTLPAVANHQNAVRQLRGFERIFLRKGAGASVKFELDRRDLSHWDALRQEWHLSHGVYKFTTGPSSRVIGQEASLQL